MHNQSFCYVFIKGQMIEQSRITLIPVSYGEPPEALRRQILLLSRRYIVQPSFILTTCYENLRGKHNLFYKRILDKALFALFHFTQNRHYDKIRFSERITSVERSQQISSEFPTVCFNVCTQARCFISGKKKTNC